MLSATDSLLTIADQANTIRRMGEAIDARDARIRDLEAALAAVRPDLPDGESTGTMSADGQTEGP